MSYFYFTYQDPVADSTGKTPVITPLEQNQDSLTNIVLPPDTNPKKTSTALTHQLRPKKIINKKAPDKSAVIDSLFGTTKVIPPPVRNVKKTITKEPDFIYYTPSSKPIGIASWQVFILLLSFVLLGVVKAFGNRRFRQIIRSFTRHRASLEILREEKKFFHRTNILLSIIHLFTTSLFVFHINLVFNFSPYISNNFQSYIIIFTIIIAIYISKSITIRFLAFLFNYKEKVSEYLFNIFLFNSLLGILLLPVICFLYFTDYSTLFLLQYIGIPLTLILFIYRGIRILLIGFLGKIPYSYIFLYICTLEILPLVVLYKFFILN